MPRAGDRRVPQYPPAWSPDLRLALDRVETAGAAADGRWGAGADGGSAVPQWQPAPLPPQFQKAAAATRPAQLPRARSGSGHSGGWHTSADLALRWLRPAPKPARASSMPIAHDFDPQLASPIRKPSRQHLQSSVGRQRASPSGTTIRVVSSDWTPEGFERTVGVFAAGRPQWSPLLRKTLSHSSGEALAAPGRLRTQSHPSTQTGGADGGALASPVGARVSWPPASFPPNHDGGWAAPLAHPQLLEQPRAAARHAGPMPTSSPAVLPPVPAMMANFFDREQASQPATVPPRGRCASLCSHPSRVLPGVAREHAALRFGLAIWPRTLDVTDWDRKSVMLAALVTRRMAGATLNSGLHAVDCT